MWMPKLNKDAVIVGVLFLVFYPVGTIADNWLVSKGIYPFIGGSGSPIGVGTLIAVVLALTVHVVIKKIRNNKNK